MTVCSINLVKIYDLTEKHLKILDILSAIMLSDAMLYVTFL
jgi:hypothetical protein